VLWLTPKDLWNVNKFYSSINHQNFFAAVLNNIMLEDDCGNLYTGLPVQLAQYLQAPPHKGLQNCLSSYYSVPPTPSHTPSLM
jgi:hypothetical protein